jgi:hypothetical protein
MASPREITNASKTTPSARGWVWEFLAVVLGIGIGLAFATNTIPAPWSGLGKPWSRIITLVIAIIAGASVADRIRWAWTWLRGPAALRFRHDGGSRRGPDREQAAGPATCAERYDTDGTWRTWSGPQ